MADNNRNRSNQFNKNWDRNDQDDQNRNRENYGNTGYDYESQDRNRRTRYGSSSYGESGYGRENQGHYGGGRGNEYGFQSGESHGQGNYGDRFRQPGQVWQQSGSSEYRNENDWTRNQGYGYGSGQNQDWQQRRNRNYGSQYGTSGSYEGRFDRGYGEGYASSGYSGNQDYGSQNYGNQNYGRSGQDRNRDWWDRTKDEVSSWFGDEDAERRRRVDRMQGPYKGKGPKDYQRSEDRIKEDVCDRLSDDDYVDASNIQVQIQGTEVILTGTVDSREQKRRAEDVVESISGVRNVENRIRIEQSGSETWGSHERPTVLGKNRML